MYSNNKISYNEFDKYVYKLQRNTGNNQHTTVTQAMINDYYTVGVQKPVTTEQSNDNIELQSVSVTGGRMLEDTLNDLGDKRPLTGGNQVPPNMKRSVYPYNLY